MNTESEMKICDAEPEVYHMPWGTVTKQEMDDMQELCAECKAARERWKQQASPEELAAWEKMCEEAFLD